MNYTQLAAVLRARWKMISIIFGAILGTAIAITSLLPRMYTASATVVLDTKSPDPIAGMVLPGMIQPGYMATQLDILQSDRVTLGAIKILNLDKNEELRQTWIEDTNREEGYESWLISAIRKGLELKPSRESSAIRINYTAADPKFAAAVANAYVRSYIETTLTLRVQPAKQYSEVFSSQAKNARDQLEAAQKQLSDYQKSRGIIIPTDERLDVETAKLAELSSQLVAIQAFSVESSSRARNSSANSLEVLNNPVISTLKADLSRQEAKQKELAARFGAAHPTLTEVNASIVELRERINAEIKRVTSSTTISDSINRERESAIRKAFADQQQKILRLKALRDEASVLMRDVESAQRAYDSLSARQIQATIESQNSQTNVSILNDAIPPALASSPKTGVNIALGAIIGITLAIFTAFVFEMYSRKLRVEDDVREILDQRMLAMIPKHVPESTELATTPLLTLKRAAIGSVPRITTTTK